MKQANWNDFEQWSLEAFKERLCYLLATQAYQEGEFTLSSGQTSNYYINGKQVSLTAEGSLAIGQLFVSRLPSDTQAVAGLTLGADPLISAVTVVSALKKVPVSGMIVRKNPKGYGTNAYLEGKILPSQAKVVVLEDVVTTGKSALFAVERLQAVGYEVSQILALVDRHQGGQQLYQQQGIPFEALFSIRDIQNYARQVN